MNFIDGANRGCLQAHRERLRNRMKNKKLTFLIW